MWDKINSHICLMLSAYKSFHQMVNMATKETIYYKNLTKLEILNLQKNDINIPRTHTGIKPVLNTLQAEHSNKSVSWEPEGLFKPFNEYCLPKLSGIAMQLVAIGLAAYSQVTNQQRSIKSFFFVCDWAGSASE